MKRILFITPQPWFQWRGSPIRVGFNVHALSELGYDVDLLTLPFGEDRTVPGVRVLRVGNFLGRANIPIGPSVWKIFFDAKLWAQARRLIREKPYDVIHAVEDAGVIAVSLARQSQAKLVFEKHSDPRSYRKGLLRNAVLWAYEKAEAYAIRHADAVIGTGPGLVEQALAVAPDKPVHHIFDIPSSLAEPDPAAVQNWETRLRQHPDETQVTYVGSFAVYQGIELLFDCIPLVLQKAPHVRFVIIGGTPEEIKTRQARLRSVGAENAVTFLGKIPPDELPSALAASDILLSTRIAGTNTPLKLLDYLKVGRAIVATDNEANRQILTDEMAVFAPPEPDAFAQAIAQLAGDKTRRENMGAHGRRVIDSLYNYTEFKRRLQEVYRHL